MFYVGTVSQSMSSVFFQSPIEKCFVGDVIISGEVY